MMTPRLAETCLGKWGGAKAKRPILIVVENKGKNAGVVANETLETFSGRDIKGFVKRHIKARG
jgi:hypothetical protein